MIPQEWMRDPATVRLMDVLTDGDHKAWFVGGCVRDSLLRRPITDIDIAVTETPADVMKRLQSAGVHVIPTGLKHGTVTAVIDDVFFEVTTLRRDVATDGRHAEVAFTDDWATDAARRDFTINALYMDQDFVLYDVFDGLEDLAEGRVRFVGSAQQRIAEDYLRILRFFRFHVRFAAAGPDPEALKACSDAAKMLPQLSPERIRQELFKLLVGPRPSTILIVMAEALVLHHILSEAQDFARLAALDTVEGLTTGADPVRRLASLLPSPFDGTAALARRLRLSNKEVQRLAVLTNPPVELSSEMSLQARRRALHTVPQPEFTDLVLLAWAGSLAHTLPQTKSVSRWDTEAWLQVLRTPAEAPVPPMPLRGDDLQAIGVMPGPALGQMLRDVEAWWRDSDFTATADECLAYAKRCLARDGSQAD